MMPGKMKNRRIKMYLMLILKAFVAIVIFSGLISITFDRESDAKDVTFSVICNMLVQLAIWG
jgi:hypothetical protein